MPPQIRSLDCRVTAIYEFVNMGLVLYNISLYMQNEYRPFFEIEFDFTTSLSKHDAVLAMLGWIRKPYREVSEAESDYQYRVSCDHPVTEEEDIRFGPHSHSLFEVLREIKESADSEYNDAKTEEPSDEKLLTEKLASIKKSHELIETAYEFYCGIDDELAKGEGSQLRLDRYVTKDPENPYITLRSLAKWASKEYGITLIKSTRVTFKDLDPSQQEVIDSLQSNKADTTHLQVTFALLVEAFSKTAPRFQNGNNNPNASVITTEICSKISARDERLGLSKRNIEGYISSVLKKKKGNGTQKNSINPKTLNQCLAFLIDAFISRDSQTTIEKIAEQLAGQATDLPEQTQDQIESRIHEALEIKKNPYSRNTK